MREPRIYAPADRPDVEVLVDGDWLPGELRMWMPEGEDAWSAQVQWRPPGTNSRRIDTFEAARVRAVDEDPTDRGVSAPGGTVTPCTTTPPPAAT